MNWDYCANCGGCRGLRRNPRHSSRHNPFFHRPEGLYHGPTASGVYKYPGFHTSEDEETAYPYAQLKIRDGIDEEGMWMPDYPVIISLDMSDLTRLADYDALETAQDAVRATAQECFREFPEDPLSYFQYDDLDMADPVDDEIGAMFQEWGRCVYSPAGCLRSIIEDMTDAGAIAALRSLASDVPDHSLLMDVVGQYRYEEDVDESRVTSVIYMAPFWKEMFEEDGDPAKEKEAAAIEGAGFQVISPDYIHAETTTVWEREPDPGSRIEYHGTSYRNLILAAPAFEDLLPTPPRPYLSEAEIGLLEMKRRIDKD